MSAVHDHLTRAKHALDEFIIELTAIVTDPTAEDQLSADARSRVNHALAMATTERELAFRIGGHR